MLNIGRVINKLLSFRDARDWKQFHDNKNLASAIAIEAAELNELFLWKTKEQSEDVPKEKIREELADILSYCFLLAHKLDLDIAEIISQKIEKNELRYPVSKSRGNSNKYDQL